MGKKSLLNFLVHVDLYTLIRHKTAVFAAALIQRTKLQKHERKECLKLIKKGPRVRYLLSIPALVIDGIW